MSYSPIIRNTEIKSDVSSSPVAVMCEDVYDVDTHRDKYGKLHSLMWDLNADKFFIEVNRESDFFWVDAEDIGKRGWKYDVTVCMAVVEFDSKVDAMRKWIEVQSY